MRGERHRPYGSAPRTAKQRRASALAYVLNAKQPTADVLVSCHGVSREDAEAMIAEARAARERML